MSLCLKDTSYFRLPRSISLTLFSLGVLWGSGYSGGGGGGHHLHVEVKRYSGASVSQPSPWGTHSRSTFLLWTVWQGSSEGAKSRTGRVPWRTGLADAAVSNLLCEAAIYGLQVQGSAVCL